MPNRAPLAVLALACSLVPAAARSRGDELDLARDLGVAVSDVRERSAELAPAARARVAEHVGCAPGELAGARVFAGRVAARGGATRECALVALPLAGPAAGARLVLSVERGRAHELGLWGALDFDEDPTLRWWAFLEQLRVAGTRQTGAEVGPVTLAGPPASELEARVRELEGAELYLVGQRLLMRRSGVLLALSRRKSRPPLEWVAAIAADARALAEGSPALGELLGADGARKHAELAREYAGALDALAALPTDAPRETAGAHEARALESCKRCHTARGPDGREWRELVGERREELDLAATQLWVGLDVAAAPGDDGRVSREIATKVKAAILLVETLGP